MKRFALTICLAACLVFLSAAAVFAVNNVTVESKTVGAGGSASIGIYATNDVIIKQYIQPLKIVSTGGGSFITSMKVGINAAGRMNGKLVDIMIYNGYLNANGACLTTAPNVGFGTIDEPNLDANTLPVSGTGPVALMIVRGIILGTTLPVGTDGTFPGGSPSFTIDVGLNASCPGQFEVDTTCTDPANHLVFAKMTAPPALLPTFTKGVINVICNPCPVNTTNPATVNATVGSSASKALSATDDEADTFDWFGPAGKGTITTTNPGPPTAAGLWSYTPVPADYPGFDVVFQVYNSNGKGNCGSYTFHVNVAPTPLVLSNCGDVTVHWGALASKTVGVSGGCTPYGFSGGLPGAVDPDLGNWTYQTSCQTLGSTPISIQVTDVCQQSADCNFDLIVTNSKPTCTNPADVTAPTGLLLSIDMGPTIDTDGDLLTYSASGTWPAWLSISGDKIVGARPLGDDLPYVVCFTVSDGCETSAPCCVNVLFESKFRICVVDLDANGDAILPADYAHTFGGQNHTVGIWVDPATGPSGGVGGFEFLICYDQSLLRFLSAARGGDLDPTWEYFTYRTGQFGGNCGGACPNGYVKLVGIADMNNGVTPAPSAFKLAGVIATLTFFVDGNVNYIGLCPHVGFCSYDCTDNSISSKDGYTLYVPTGVGITLGPDYSCDGNNKPGHVVNPFIDFCPGAICIDRPPDDRGDVNLNGVANEIGDAVLLSNYFIYGINVFETAPNLRAVQILATDINNDGLTLTVADLVYLIRILTGDAQPFPPQGSGFKLSPYANAVDVISDVTDGALTVRTNSTVDLGGALFVYRYSGLTVGEPALAAGTNLKIKSRASNGELRILVFGTASGARVPAGLNNFITVPVSGNGTIELAESQVSDANGALLTVNAAAKATPSTYALLQNYPNPFNAGTVIQFSLKDQADWNLSIYNIAGQIVRTFSGNGQGSVSVAWDGTSEGGSTIASGMYFYRLSTREFTATKKMVLMK